MTRIDRLPLTLGIHSTYKGYHYLVASLRIALSDEQNLMYFTKTIFPKVARMFNTTPCCVERNIRTIIYVCWNSDNRQALQDLAPYTLHQPPTVGEFLDILYWNLK